MINGTPALFRGGPIAPPDWGPGNVMGSSRRNRFQQTGEHVVPLPVIGEAETLVRLIAMRDGE